MSKIPLGMPGWIYVMSNPSLSTPGEGPLLKIGCSTNDPQIRAKQLTASTSSPTSFTVVYAREVRDANKAEKQIHTALAGYRVNEGREFFRVSVYEAARTVDAICGETFSRLDPPTPFAELFASFKDSDNPELNEEEQLACRSLERRLSEKGRG